MSSKILEILRKIDEASSRQECFSVQRLTDDLRVLLAAPVVERQPVQWQRKSKMHGDCWYQLPADEVDQAKNSGYEIRGLYTAPPGLAELQATIARLTAELTEVKRHKHAADVALEAVKFNLDKTDKRYLAAVAEIERLKGGQGEPVAEVIEHYGFDDGIIRFKTSNMEQLPIGTVLYASQPATVSVDESSTSDKYRAELYDEVWQKARDMGFANVTDALDRLDDIDGCPRLDKVKELNQ